MSGTELEIVRVPALEPTSAATIAGVLAQMEPWTRLGYSAEALSRGLQIQHPDLLRYLLLRAGETLGLATIRYPWLRGAYIELFAVLPAAQNQGVGKAILGHLEASYRERTGNLWLLVSAFNARALRFYVDRGFVPIGTLPDLVVAGEDEILMRKRL